MERTRQTTEVVRQVEATASKPYQPRLIDTSNLISSGITLLNCACSDNPMGAFGLGKIVTLPGASKSGKTLMILTMLAEMSIDPRFDHYDFYYDDIEHALEFDISYLFGKRLAQRLLAPDGRPLLIPVEGPDGEEHFVINPDATFSETIQDMERNILTKCRDVKLVRGKAKESTDSECKPFIYAADSLDALTSSEELEKEYRRALQNIMSEDHLKEVKGSYNTEKAKILGQTLRMIKKRLSIMDSTFFLVQQIRQKIGVQFGKTDTTSGGNAPFFYSTHQVWLHHLQSITAGPEGNKLKIGNAVKAEVTKNKLTGKERNVEFNAYNDLGVDDITANVDYLCKNHWKNARRNGKMLPGTFDAEELNIQGGKATLVKTIEERNLENEVRKIIGQTWNELEESVRLHHRKRKYL